MRTHHVSQSVGQSMWTGAWDPVATTCEIPAAMSGAFSIDWKHVSCPDCLATRAVEG